MRAVWAIAMLTLLAPQTAIGQPVPTRRATIEIGNPDFRPYPMGVPEARAATGDAAGRAAAQITETLRWDFSLSPIFKVLDPKSYLANPAKEGMTAASIRFSDWVNIGAEGLVKAQTSMQGTTLKCEFHFFDVTSGRELLKKNYDGTVEDAARLAHRFANDVVYFLTGTKGPFLTLIAAVKKSKSGREIVVLDADGTRERSVTSNGSINLLPAFSRNGKEILFTSYMRHNPNLYSTPLFDGQKPKLLSGERGLNTGGAMSPDGKKIALTLSRDGNSEIYVMNADGTGLVRLTNEWAIDSSPTWSPDGKRIAFVSARWGDPHIFVMNADGSEVRRLTDKGTYNQTPDWSPRGDLIAFTARDERNAFDIFTVNPSTKEIRRITQDQGNNEEPTFSPDGSLIAFVSMREGRSQIWVAALDGTHQRRLTEGGGYLTPTWSPFLEP